MFNNFVSGRKHICYGMGVIIDVVLASWESGEEISSYAKPALNHIGHTISMSGSMVCWHVTL